MASRHVLTQEDCLEIARCFFGYSDVEITKWRENRLSDKPAGFLGDHKLAEIYASCGTRNAIIPVFMKTMPTNENQVKLITTTGAFRKEVMFYQNVVRAWEERGLLSSDSIADRKQEDEITWNCRIYFARNDAIILENIGALGYKSDTARNPYDYEHAVMALRMLAPFHAASLVYEEQKTSELGKSYRLGEEFPEMVEDTFYLIKEGHPGERTTETGLYAIVECAKLLPVCENPEVKKLVTEKMPDVLRKVFESVKASKRFRNVLCHCDLWQNNILFRYSKTEKEKTHPNDDVLPSSLHPLDVKLVDFQLLRYTPPAQDIFSLLHLTTRKALRDSRGDDLLDEYYCALAAALRRRGVDPERVLPREEFNESLEEQRFAGRLAGLFALHFLLSNDEAMAPVFRDEEHYKLTMWKNETRAEMVCSQFLNDPVYKERLEESLMELLEEDVFV